MTVWLIILGMVVVTYGMRLGGVILLDENRMSPGIYQALRYVPPAALSAIIFPEIFMPEGTLDLAPGNLRLWAGLMAALVAWRSKNTLLALGVGMVILWGLQYVSPVI